MCQGTGSDRCTKCEAEMGCVGRWETQNATGEGSKQEGERWAGHEIFLLLLISKGR